MVKLANEDIKTREVLENAKLVEKFSEALMEDDRNKAQEEREIQVRKDLEDLEDRDQD